MESGYKFNADKLYYTKDGRGNVIPFNEGWDFTNRKRCILPIFSTDTKDVYTSGRVGRYIKDIAETAEEAKLIQYGKN